MPACCTFATSSLDGQGDVMEMSGLDTSVHELNPVVLFNHGIQISNAVQVQGIPIIGKTRSPEGEYTVHVLADKAYQTTYFSQTNPLAEQVYALIEEEII